MKSLERLGLRLLRQMDPETSHALALKALRCRLGPRADSRCSVRLQVRLAGLDLPNPLGLAAGLDKNAVAIAPLSAAGFGFVEVGAATPLPQPGNPRPRMFRLSEDRAVINRFGFNNEGMDAITRRLARRPPLGIVGINLGANKESSDRAADFARVLRRTGPHVDFATVNVSSPNTERLRDLQGRAALSALLGVVMEENASLARPLPIFLKVAPDLSRDELEDIAEVAIATGLAGIIATNTTLAREGLGSPHRREAGGLSGAPLFARATIILARLALLTDGRLPLVGVGGIGSADDAYAKIRAGATALQLYSALTYKGLSLVPEILQGLDALLERDGFARIHEAVGIDAACWAEKPL
jgi:dihydroorotate dehydrogenase